MTRIMHEHSQKKTTCVESVQLEAARVETMEGDVGVHILSFVPDEDMTNVAVTTRGLGDKVQESRNTKQRYMGIDTF